MLSKQEEQQDRLEVLRNDRLVREQGSTFFAHTHNDVGGRFAAVSSPQVIGSTPNPATQYPAAADWVADQLPPEPPFPIDISAQEPCGEKFEVERSRDAVGPVQLGQAQEPLTPDAPPSPLAGDVARRRGPLSSRTYRRK